jgi:L-aminopeptidase/D-esterase-like protein
VQANYGKRYQLRIAGVPVGAELPEDVFRREEKGSIIAVIATDAPLLPHQLKRLARRASMGLARMGSISGNGSGDLFIAFSNANPEASKTSGMASVQMIPNDALDPFFEAAVQSVEESIVNALVAAKTLVGNKGFKVRALPHHRLQALLKKYNRLTRP